ncbi:MAG: DUF2240 family protein [Candidatus Poseidoniaceae archaeon]|nr:DUF2240 family protein [Candidatus Poseidoniaceae archaeon]
MSPCLVIKLSNMDTKMSEDIGRVMALTWRGVQGPIKPEVVSRIWSLDLQWLKPMEAEVAVAALVEAGWFIESDSGIIPAAIPNDAKTPLGWFPRPSILMHPQRFLSTQQGLEIPADIEVQHVKPIAEQSSDESVMVVAEATGLEAAEIRRRCERKKRALGPVEEWFCLALLAREQGLEISPLIPILRK